MRVRVHYMDEEVWLDLAKGQCFQDFRSWAYFRFRIPDSDHVLFLQGNSDTENKRDKELTGRKQTEWKTSVESEHSTEVIPSYNQLKSVKPSDRIIRIVNCSCEKTTVPPDLTQSRWQLRFWYPIFAIFLLCVVLDDPRSFVSGGDVSRHSVIATLQNFIIYYQSIWQSYFGITLPDKVVIDSLTTLLAYPVTTFYIRRALNPDTGMFDNL